MRTKQMKTKEPNQALQTISCSVTVAAEPLCVPPHEMSDLKRWAKNIRANWLTSLIAGQAFGVSLTLVPSNTQFGAILIVVIFLASNLLGVFGVVQMKEMFAERKRRGLGLFGTLAEHGDVRRFCFPIWKRMFVWLPSAVLGAITTEHVFK